MDGSWCSAFSGANWFGFKIDRFISSRKVVFRRWRIFQVSRPSLIQSVMLSDNNQSVMSFKGDSGCPGVTGTKWKRYAYLNSKAADLSLTKMNLRCRQTRCLVRKLIFTYRILFKPLTRISKGLISTAVSVSPFWSWSGFAYKNQYKTWNSIPKNGVYLLSVVCYSSPP